MFPFLFLIQAQHPNLQYLQLRNSNLIVFHFLTINHGIQTLVQPAFSFRENFLPRTSLWPFRIFFITYFVILKYGKGLPQNFVVDFVLFKFILSPLYLSWFSSFSKFHFFFLKFQKHFLDKNKIVDSAPTSLEKYQAYLKISPLFLLQEIYRLTA